MEVKEESQELLEAKHNFIPGEKSLSCSLTDNTNKSPKRERDKKVFICPQCAKSFTQKIGLERHMLIHSGEKPFTCSQCGKSFRLKGNLVDHIRNRSHATNAVRVSHTKQV